MVFPPSHFEIPHLFRYRKNAQLMDFRWFQRARPACISWTMTQGLELETSRWLLVESSGIARNADFPKTKKKLHSHSCYMFRFKSNWMLNMPYNIDNRLEVASGNIWLENVFIVFWSLWFVSQVRASEIKKAQYEILQNSDHRQYHPWFLGYAWLCQPSQQQSSKVDQPNLTQLVTLT